MPTKAQYQAYLAFPQARAALDTIAWAEGGISYNTLYGGGTFSGSQHPNRAITAGGYTSTAAGRYQFLYRTWIEVKNRLGLADFTGPNQDIAALDLISQRGQLQKLLNGDFEGMLKGLGCAWAALPYSTCGQKMRPLNQTLNYYNSALRVYGGQPGATSTANSSLPTSTPSVAAVSTVGAVAAAVLLFLLIDR